MPITFFPRPLTAAERAAGWGAVLITPDVSMQPVYLAHPGDIPTFPASDMAQVIARVYRRPIAAEVSA